MAIVEILPPMRLALCDGVQRSESLDDLRTSAHLHCNRGLTGTLRSTGDSSRTDTVSGLDWFFAGIEPKAPKTSPLNRAPLI